MQFLRAWLNAEVGSRQILKPAAHNPSNHHRRAERNGMAMQLPKILRHLRGLKGMMLLPPQPPAVTAMGETMRLTETGKPIRRMPLKRKRTAPNAGRTEDEYKPDASPMLGRQSSVLLTRAA